MFVMSFRILASQAEATSGIDDLGFGEAGAHRVRGESLEQWTTGWAGSGHRDDRTGTRGASAAGSPGLLDLPAGLQTSAGPSKRVNLKSTRELEHLGP